MAHAELDRLQACLNFALDKLRKELDNSQLPPLSQLSSVEHPLDDPTTYLPSTGLFEARRLSLACLGELKNLIQSPLDKCMDERFTAYGVACTDTLIKTGIIDYLSDVPNPSQGVPAAELASKFELDSQKLVPILRCCAANGWVRETRDSSFALNRCSRTFIEGHAGRRLNFFMPGFVTMIETIPYWVAESEWKLSRSPEQTAFQIAFKTPLLAFSWIMENPEVLIPIANHLKSVAGDMSTPSIVADYPWEQLETPVIVDCGGGEGGLVSAILDAHPSFRAIVQDMENVVALTSSIMEERRPRDIENGVLKVEAHDLFQPQAWIGNEYSFILRHIMHDWPDKEAATILGHVARALGPKSKILIIDMVAVPNVNATATTSFESFLLDSDAKRLDCTIPSHFGSASKIVSGSSMHMLTMINGCERSLREWEALVRACGLRIMNVYPLRAHTSIIECALDTRALL
ncbi:O-methyltransferase-domain-containing protein [Suillus paluster]|uniref:O-methyltransferase-domain-containing protein n=1 Tax=Suillus paluster TaxID=48578 RepID=UPI001B85BCD8|nr:O-methyltransferase-domain-containing protein [Suillus paluster]KAG1747831.1 O-methyltransferase-domain-containing protein [Suillus paluster]